MRKQGKEQKLNESKNLESNRRHVGSGGSGRLKPHSLLFSSINNRIIKYKRSPDGMEEVGQAS